MKNSVKNLSAVRAVALFTILLLGIGFSCLRVAMINFRYSSAASEINTSKSLTLGVSRGVIYDTELNRLTCTESDFVCAVKPSVKALAEIREFLSAEEYVAAVEAVSKNNPMLLHPEFDITSDEIISERIYKRYNNSCLAAHIIGYTDSTGTKGISGIEKAFDNVLSQYSGRVSVRFFSNGAGGIMEGGKSEKVDENYNSDGGVVLSVKKSFQSALEKSMDYRGIKKGAAVMLDIKTGAVVAAVSRPNFNPDAVSDYLDDESEALFNRAFGAYPVGSVFKPLVAASALEQGIDPSAEFYCSGKTSAGGVEFRCMKSHGNVNMASALVFSCNCYFVDLMNRIDSVQVRELADSIGFGRKTVLADGVETYSGYLPDEEELASTAQSANFSFGQGLLTATPVQIACLYSALANSGSFRMPYLVEGFCDGEGVFRSAHTAKPPYSVFSKKTSQWLISFLDLAVREGTGKNAAVEDVLVCGKTATAQTGDFSSGKERLVTWFAGFFPAESPEYTLVVMCEDGTSGSQDCAPVFGDVVRAVTQVVK